MILGLFVLLMATLVTSAFLTAALFGVMFALHKYAAGKIPDTGYEHFDFDNITRPTLSEFLVRLAAVVFPATIILPVILTIIFPPLQGFRAHYFLFSFILWLLETVAIAIGLIYILKIDRTRVAVLTAAASLSYLLLYWLFIYGDLYG